MGGTEDKQHAAFWKIPLSFSPLTVGDSVFIGRDLVLGTLLSFRGHLEEKVSPLFTYFPLWQKGGIQGGFSWWLGRLDLGILNLVI
jgi:hypothetical protein